jgi:CubicO group peptidase (beta-lactamase class C family)
MRKMSFVLFVLMILVQCIFGQQKFVEATPESQKFSRERLYRIDNMVKGYIDEGKMNSAAALIIRNGKIVYYRAFGYDDKEEKKPLKRDAIFRIASQTKAITSTAILMLYEEGKFLLDDPISKYIHSFKNPQVLEKFNPKDSSFTTVPAKREVTIRDLLRHTSGIGYAQIGSPESNAIYAKNNIRSFLGQGSASLAEDMQKLGELPLMHNPGEKFTYGLNADVLGYLVEVISGMSLNDFFQTRIFTPLGMKDTYFYIPPVKQNRLVTVYHADSTGKLLKLPSDFNDNGPLDINYPKNNGTYYSGGAGLSSTMYDYAIFLQMILNGGEYDGKRLLSPHTIRMMTMDQLGNINYGENTFGLGFNVVTEKGSAASPVPQGSFDWGGIYSTKYWVDPKNKLIGLFYKQFWNDPSEGSTEKFQVMTYAALTE